MLSVKKKVGIGLVLCAAVSLFIAFLGIPLSFSSRAEAVLVAAGGG